MNLPVLSTNPQCTLLFSLDTNLFLILHPTHANFCGPPVHVIKWMFLTVSDSTSVNKIMVTK